MSLTNLTPHPIRVYGWDVPDQFEVGDFEPWLELPAADKPARIGQIDLGTTHLRACDAPVELIEYRHFTNLPPKQEGPWDGNTTWYVVSLALALACNNPGDKAHYRCDLLIPYRELRRPTGGVIGCRALALPV